MNKKIDTFINNVVKYFFVICTIIVTVIYIVLCKDYIKLSLILIGIFLSVIYMLNVCIYKKDYIKQIYLFIIVCFIIIGSIYNACSFNKFQSMNNGWKIVKSDTPYYFDTMFNSLGGWEQHEGRVMAFAELYLKNKNVYINEESAISTYDFKYNIFPKNVFSVEIKKINKKQKDALFSNTIMYQIENGKLICFVFDENWKESNEIILVIDNDKNNYYMPMVTFNSIKNIN